MSQITWLPKEVFCLLAKYVVLCNSINCFDFLCESKKFAKTTAFRLNSLKATCLDFVATVCSKIVLFTFQPIIKSLKKQEVTAFPLLVKTSILFVAVLWFYNYNKDGQ